MQLDFIGWWNKKEKHGEEGDLESPVFYFAKSFKSAIIYYHHYVIKHSIKIE